MTNTTTLTMGPPDDPSVDYDELLLMLAPELEPDYPEVYEEIDIHQYDHVLPLDTGLFVFDILLIALIIISNI